MSATRQRVQRVDRTLRRLERRQAAERRQRREDDKLAAEVGGRLSRAVRQMLREYRR